MSEINLSVPEIHCEACVSAIRKSLSALDGIEEVAADLAAGQVRVRYDEARTGPAAIRDRVEKAGFDVA